MLRQIATLVITITLAMAGCGLVYGEDDHLLDASEWIGSPAVPLTIRHQTDPFLVGLAIGRAMRRVPRHECVTPSVTPASPPPRIVCLEFDITEDNEFVCVKYEVKHGR